MIFGGSVIAERLYIDVKQDLKKKKKKKKSSVKMQAPAALQIAGGKK